MRAPASRFVGQDAGYELLNANDATVQRAFSDGQAEAREPRQIVTGNIIGGLDRLGSGQIVMFTRADGTTDQGILMPKDFNARKALEDRPVAFADTEQALQFLDTAGGRNTPSQIKSEDGTFSANRTYGGYVVTIQRKGGKPYILSPGARDIVGDFTSRTGPYRKEVDRAQLAGLLDVYRDTLGAVFQAEAHKDEAREITGESLPDFDGDPEMREAGPQPVATLRGDELGDWSDIRQLGRKAEAWYRKNLVGSTVTNRKTGWLIDFRKDGSKKIGGRKGDTIYRSVPALREILENGTYVGTEPDRLGRPDIKAVHKFGATIILEGKPRDLIVTVREDTKGKYHYDLSRDMSDGARFMHDGGNAVRVGKAQVRNPALEGSTVPLNIELQPANGKPGPVGWDFAETVERITDARLSEIAADAQREMRQSGLAGKVTAKVVRNITDKSADVAGVYRRTRGRIDVRADAAAGAIGTLRHEIVHALRDSTYWGRAYGLFTRAEWQGLVREARRDKAALADLRERYPDLSEPALMEEAVAEMYRRWREGAWDGAKPAETALGKIRAFFEALANAFRGRGFQSAARTMQQIADGGVAGRGDPNPTGPGDGEKFALSDTVRDKIGAIWRGQTADAPVVLGRLPAVLRALTGKDNQLVVASRVIRKAGSHGLTEADVNAAIEGLDDPVMVFDARNAPGNFTVLVDKPAADGRSMVLGLDVAFKAGRLEISRIATIHGKDRDSGTIGLIRDGYLRYVNKRKAAAWSRSRGLQLPKDGTTMPRHGKKILQYRDVFKGGADPEMRAPKRRNPGLEAAANVTAKSAGQLMSDVLTQAMAGKGGANILALVPGRALMTELGAKMPATSAGSILNSVYLALPMRVSEKVTH